MKKLVLLGLFLSMVSTSALAGTMNIILSNYSVTANLTYWPTFEGNPGDIVSCDINVNSVSGAPTAFTLTPAFALAPINYNGQPLDAENTAGYLKVFTPASYSGNQFKPSLIDGDWPVITATSTFAFPYITTVRIQLPAEYTLFQINLTPSFTGGTSPSLAVSETCTDLSN